MTIQQQRRKLAKQAAQYQAAMRKKLEQIVKPGAGNGQWMGPHVNSFGGPNNSAATTFQFGQAITDADVARFVKRAGGNPYIKALAIVDEKAREAKRSGYSRTGRNVTKAANDAIHQLMASAQAKVDEANAANERRFSYGIGNLEALRDRNQERVKNFGQSAKTDITERLDQNLADIVASQGDRGLGNSTVRDAFAAKTATDKAREIQRISEMVDDRASRYDTADTANAVSFAERRNDVAPDLGQLTALAQLYGASGAGGGAAGVPATSASASNEAIPLRFSTNLPYATSAWNAARIAGSYQNMAAGMYGDPLAAQRAAVGGIVPTPQTIESNRYPQRRTPQKYTDINYAVQGKYMRPLQVSRQTALPATTRLDRLQYYV